jgi:hypothetical protein
LGERLFGVDGRHKELTKSEEAFVLVKRGTRPAESGVSRMVLRVTALGWEGRLLEKDRMGWMPEWMASLRKAVRTGKEAKTGNKTKGRIRRPILMFFNIA